MVAWKLELTPDGRFCKKLSSIWVEAEDCKPKSFAVQPSKDQAWVVQRIATAHSSRNIRQRGKIAIRKSWSITTFLRDRSKERSHTTHSTLQGMKPGRLVVGLRLAARSLAQSCPQQEGRI